MSMMTFNPFKREISSSGKAKPVKELITNYMKSD